MKYDAMTMREWFEKKAREDYPEIFLDESDEGCGGDSQGE